MRSIERHEFFGLGLPWRRLSIPTLVAIFLTIHGLSVSAATITNAHIVQIPENAVGSGNGTLDLILFTESGGGTQNSDGPFNGDNANTDLPTGSGHTTADESYVTSIGELRDYYRLNFPDGSSGSTANQIVILVDVNQQGSGSSLEIHLDTLDIYRDYTATFGDARDNPSGNDINSSLQNSTNNSFGGGTPLAGLDGTKELQYLHNGAGHADKAIFTGINPFNSGFDDSTRILFHWASSNHNDGGETVFLSGTFAAHDLSGPQIPEPSTFVLAAIVLAGRLLTRGHRRVYPDSAVTPL
jgi:hypothetical protein